jgi:glyoxylase-like metal-dependent hydrolase (beta-lactamase superfamily II)
LTSHEEDTMGTFARRQFIKLNAAAVAGIALAPTLAHGVSPTTRTVRRWRPAAARDGPPGFYRFATGDLEVTVLNDGSFLVPSDITPLDVAQAEIQALNVDPATRDEFFRSRRLPQDDLRIQANPVVLDSGDRRVLVDSGWSSEALGAPDTTGRLGPALDVAGIDPASIDLVILTHGHPDHLGGLMDPDTRAPAFSNAEIVLSDVELALWTADDAVARFQDSPLPVPAVQRLLGALDGRIRTVRAGAEVVSGVRSIPSPGHTTGHIALAVETGEEDLLLVGDAITNVHVSFERPDWHNLFDMDGAEGSHTRRRLLDRAASDDMLILGYHFPFPGIGHAVPYGDAYRWYPATRTALW